MFIHIEQDPNFRNPAEWVKAVNNTLAKPECALPTPQGLTAVAGDAKVSLNWQNVNENALRKPLLLGKFSI